jgi:hypothetical protein
MHELNRQPATTPRKNEEESRKYTENSLPSSAASDRKMKPAIPSESPGAVLGLRLVSEDMVAKARRQHRQWLGYLGIGLMVGLIPLGFIVLLIVNSANHRQIDDPVVPVPTIAGFIVLVAFGLMIARAWLARSYDPNNDDLETRKRLGQERAVLRADLKRSAREAQHRANQSNPPGEVVPPG